MRGQLTRLRETQLRDAANLALVEQHVDVITDLLEASASLAGLALVFLGMIATATASDRPGERRSVAERARRPVYAVLLAFFSGVLCVAFAAVWLVALDVRTIRSDGWSSSSSS
jgi:hypothetical protein